MSIQEKGRTPPSVFRLGPEIDAAMKRLQERDGITPSEQARRALRAWLTTKGMLKPTPSGRTTKGTR